MQIRGPWKIKSSETKYKNDWIEIKEDSVIRPDKIDGIYATVTTNPGVVTLPIDEDLNVYLTKEFRYAINEMSIEASCGGIDEGESALDAAKRELFEELGIKAEEFIALGQHHQLTSIVYSPVNLFVAKKLSFFPHENEPTEQIEMLKVSLDEAVEMVMRSEIKLCSSCLLILKAHKLFTEK